MGWKDEAFLEDLRDKTQRGMAGQVRRGLSAGGRAYGYRSEPTYNEQHQITGYKRVVDSQEAAVVRRGSSNCTTPATHRKVSFTD